MKRSYRGGMKYGMMAMVVIGIAATVALGFTLPGFGKFEKAKPVNGVVSVPVSKVSDGTAHYYRLAEGGKEISFFIVKGSDGQIHTAFDACDVCYHEKKGYEQKGDQMICKNCNRSFAINRIGAASAGGCNPAHLPARIDGGSVRIGVAEIKAGARFF